MTSPLVKPLGYSTLSRFERVSRRPSTSVVVRRSALARAGRARSGLTDDLAGALVGPQPPPRGMAEPPIAGELAVAHLPDQLRGHPVGPRRVRRGKGGGEGAATPGQRTEPPRQVAQGGFVEARAHLAHVAQAAPIGD